MPVDRLASKKHQRFFLPEGRLYRRCKAVWSGSHLILAENTNVSSQEIGPLGFSEKPLDTGLSLGTKGR
ncbi:MAG: hypothetical protein WBL40_16600, partial [Terrimicrobiaceae bacterium]